MNIKKRLRHLAQKSAQDRAMGRTTVIARAAKEIGATVIARNVQAIKYIEGHGVVARSMETNLEGLIGPFLFDHSAVEGLLEMAANKIEELEKQIEEIANTVVHYQERIENGEV